MLVGVLRADAARHGAVLRESVAYAEAHHGVLALAAFGQVGQELPYNHEGVAVVEVVTVDYAERLFYHVLGHQYGVVGAPRLHPAFRAREALRQRVKALEAQLRRHMAFVFAEDFLAEVLLEVLSYYEHDFAEAGLHGVVDRVVHYSFAVRAQPVELFQSAVTAAHAGGQQ